MKPKLIIFEGLDKSGKSTLIVNFNKLTNYQYWVLDRSIISSIVYDECFSRNYSDRHQILKTLIDAFDVRVIYCHCDKELMTQRLLKANEQLPKELLNFEKIELMFLSTITKFNIQYLFIDTSISIDECLEKIKEFVK